VTPRLVNREVAAEVRQELTGHSSDEAHQIHTHLGTQTLRDAIYTLASD